MDRISTSQTYNSALLNLLSAGARQTEAQNQVSTGKLADDLKGYGVHSDTLTGMKSFSTRLESYTANAKILSTTLDVQDQILGEASDATTGARKAVADALSSGSADGLMSALQGRMAQVLDVMNTQYQGRYLFSGGQTDTKPVQVSQLSDLTAAPSVASIFKNDQLTTSSRLDDNAVIPTGFLANDIGTDAMEAFKAVQALHEGPDGPLAGKLTPTQVTQLTAMLSKFDTAFNTFNEATAVNGVQQNRVTSVQSSLEDRQTAVTGVLAGLTDVDMAEALSRLQLSQVAMQASAQAFATLQGSSLLNALSR